MQSNQLQTRQPQALRRVVIIGGIRTPFCRAGTNFSRFYNLEMLSAALKALVEKYGLQGEVLGDVSMGAVMHHPRDWNLAREAVLNSGLSARTPGFVIQRACGTSLEAAILIANKIATGQIEVGIAGGVDSLTNPPLVYRNILSQRILKTARARRWTDRIKPWFSLKPSELLPGIPEVAENQTKLTMGEHCELMNKEWKISRLEQDKLALKSHQNAGEAYKEGFYNDLVVPFAGVSRDNNIREDTSLEKLSRLAPAFDHTPSGTLTAGNSSPLTDGAACVLLCSEEYAEKKKLIPSAYFVDCQVSAVPFDEGLLMAPAYAVAQLLKRNELSLSSFDYYEIHEAFACQVLCTLKAWESEKFCTEKLGLSKPLGSIDHSKLNVAGGSTALGHPFGATGARILATTAKLLSQKHKRRALISICTGGAMGVTAVLESTQKT